MALNKLSIDKLDLKDKRVLIRYVSEKITSLRAFTPTVTAANSRANLNKVIPLLLYVFTKYEAYIILFFGVRFVRCLLFLCAVMLILDNNVKVVWRSPYIMPGNLAKQ